MDSNPGEILKNYKGVFEASEVAAYKRINREVMREISELKKALAEFDAYRHTWAEIAANNVGPGRDSDYCRLLEVMQGRALTEVDAAAWRLRAQIRGEDWKNCPKCGKLMAEEPKFPGLWVCPDGKKRLTAVPPYLFKCSGMFLTEAGQRQFDAELWRQHTEQN